jgi:hypothetical protein
MCFRGAPPRAGGTRPVPRYPLGVPLQQEMSSQNERDRVMPSLCAVPAFQYERKQGKLSHGHTTVYNTQPL